MNKGKKALTHQPTVQAAPKSLPKTPADDLTEGQELIAPLTFSLSRFQAAREKVCKTYPRAEEVLNQLTEDRVRNFLIEVRSLSPKRLTYWIQTLPAAKLALVFPAIGSTLDENTLNRLFLVVQERASWALYLTAWQAVQRTFPDDYTLRGFRLLCNHLHKRALKPPQTLQENVSQSILKARSEADFFNALFSQLTEEPAEALAAFAQTYRFDTGSVLWLFLLGQYYQSCSAKDLYSGRKDFVRLLPDLHPVQTESILKRVAMLESLGADQKQEIARYILQGLPILAPAHPLWGGLASQDLYRYYLRLAINLCLEEHCGENEVKHQFLKPHLIRMLDVARLSPSALAIRFSGFVLVDNQDYPQSIFYYTDQGIEAFLKSGREQEELAVPDFPLQTPSPLHPAETLLEEPGLLFNLEGDAGKEAQIFLNRRLGSRPVTSILTKEKKPL